MNIFFLDFHRLKFRKVSCSTLVTRSLTTDEAYMCLLYLLARR